jgi:cytidylate kinase
MVQLPSLSKRFHDISQRCIIAIDGTAASGKGTIANLLATKFSFLHCQTSIFYRSLALKAIENHIKSDDIKHIVLLSKEQNLDLTNSKDLYTEDVTQMTSIIAAIPEVRQNLYPIQRNFILNHKRVVMEGRDIGTTIAPDADFKLYITANDEIRAERRFQQLVSSGRDVTIDEVLRNLRERDERDQNRSSSPLKPAEDAIIIDTSSLTIEEVITLILQQIDNR